MGWIERERSRSASDRRPTSRRRPGDPRRESLLFFLRGGTRSRMRPLLFSARDKRYTVDFGSRRFTAGRFIVERRRRGDTRRRRRSLWRRERARRKHASGFVVVTYHEDEIKYEEQVLDHSHSAPHFDRCDSTAALVRGNCAKSEDEMPTDTRGDTTTIHDRRLGFN